MYYKVVDGVIQPLEQNRVEINIIEYQVQIDNQRFKLLANEHHKNSRLTSG